MQDLKVRTHNQAIPAFRELAALDQNEFEHLPDSAQHYIQLLENKLLALLLRTPDQIEKQVTNIINDLARITDNYMLLMKIDADYDGTFFKKEIDNNFKVKLASSLLDLLKTRFGQNYDKPLLSGIATRDLDYLDFLDVPLVSVFGDDNE